MLRRHFEIICQHMDWPMGGEILISAAGLASAPKLFDGKYDLIKRAGAELIEGVISPEVAEAISAPAMATADYRQFVALGFQGGMAAKAKLVAMTMKALRNPVEPT